MTRVLFVADQFSDATRTRGERHAGGAELTDESAISASPWPVSLKTFKTLALEGTTALNDFDVIVVANSETASPEQLQQIASTERHVTFEHDLRICRWRGNFPSGRDFVHRTLQRCWCPHTAQRALFERARGTIFLTRLQERYYRDNAFFSCGATRVLGSSLFGPALLDKPTSGTAASSRNQTTVFASPNPIKGYRQALRYCEKRGIVPSEIRGLAPEQVLEHFASMRSFVYLPIGPEWAGRMVVEARLLGCSVVVNDLVGVAGEDFWRGSRDQAVGFLSDGPKRFWRFVEELMNGEVVAPPRSAKPFEAAAEALTALLRAPPRCLWPVGPRTWRASPTHEHAAW